MPELRFWEAEKTRRRLTLEQKKFISNMYKELEEKTSLRAESLKSRTNVSSVLRTKYLEDMQKELSSELRAINKRLQSSIPSTMTKAAEAVVDSNNAWMKAVGLDVRGAYSNVPRDVVEDLVSGKLYNKQWNLSKALWSDTKDAQRDIQRVVAEGIAQNKPIYEIAKDLERYVSPTARKAWDWGKVYPGTRKVIDYNAQRLARTMVAHSYQNAFVKTTKDNPFFTAYRWLSGHSERTCDICEDRATKDGFGLGAGVFPKDQLPMDHPNGLCTWVISLEKSMKDITDDIANWYNSPSGTHPEIDKYAGKFGYKPEKAVKKAVTPTPKLTPREILQSVKRSLHDKGVSFIEISDEIEVELLTKNLRVTNGLIEKYPILQKYLKEHSINFYAGSLGKDYANRLAQVQTPSSLDFMNLQLNSKFFNSGKDLKAGIIRNMNSGWSVKLDDELADVYTMTHEMGHVLQNAMIKMKVGSRSEAELRRHYERIVEIAAKGDRHFDASRYTSRYACSSFDEFFAEVFTEYEGGSESILSRAMKQFLKEELG